MSLSVSASITAMAAGLRTSFGAQGGVEPYVYSVVPGGAGGSINSATGLYQAPAVLSDDPRKSIDVIRVTDADLATADAQIQVTSALGLFCDIIQTELELEPGRVYLWDQKIMQPKDDGLYVAVSVLQLKPFANTTSTPQGSNAIQSVNMNAVLAVDIISRGPAALNRKEELILALNSIYAQSQQELNSFFIGKLPSGGQFVNLSNVDGAAIPYRFNLSVNMQYMVRKVKAVPYFDEFEDVEVVTEP